MNGGESYQYCQLCEDNTPHHWTGRQWICLDCHGQPARAKRLRRERVERLRELRAVRALVEAMKEPESEK